MNCAAGGPRVWTKKGCGRPSTHSPITPCVQTGGSVVITANIQWVGAGFPPGAVHRWTPNMWKTHPRISPSRIFGAGYVKRPTGTFPAGAPTPWEIPGHILTGAAGKAVVYQYFMILRQKLAARASRLTWPSHVGPATASLSLHTRRPRPISGGHML